MLLTVGGAQTNHGRLTAAVATKHGMKAAIVAVDPYPGEISANLILDGIMGCPVYLVQSDGSRPSEEVEAEDCRPELSRRPCPRTDAVWKVGGFLVPVIFRCAFHNLRLFFYAVAEPVWMVSWFRSFARPGLARARFLRQIRSPAGKEEDFAQNPRGA